MHLAGATGEHRSASSKHAACTRRSDAAKENIEARETSWCAAAVNTEFLRSRSS